MATNRGERMQERMRGAGRHEVADESFGFVLPSEDASEAPAADSTPSQPSVAASVARSTASNTSVKRRRLNDDNAPARQSPSPHQTSEPQRPSSASKPDPYDQEQYEEKQRQGPELSSPVSLAIRQRTEIGAGTDEIENSDDGHGSPSKVVARPGSGASISSRLSAGPHITEEVTESPAGAPGSGHRRRIRMSNATTQSAQLQRMVMDLEAGHTGELEASSPLARKTRMSGVTAGALSARSRGTARRSALAQSFNDADELSPVPRPARRSNSTAGSGSARSSLSVARRNTLSTVNDEPDELSSPVPLVESRRRAQAKTKAKKMMQPSPLVNQSVDGTEILDETRPELAGTRVGEEAESIETPEAARVMGRKRRRPSPPREESPELDARREEPEPLAKKQPRTRGSPAKQSQPKATSKKKQGGVQKPVRKRHSGENEHIPIAVQRYTRRLHQLEDDTDADILGAEIPFSNRSGVNVVDVLLQMCEEVIDSNLATLHEAALNADSSGKKKEYRTKLRALEAFQAELRTRLIDHTIKLDTMHALRKRVRAVQKERLALRNELLRIRAEREQVALKMDAIRMRHDHESKHTLDQLHLSTTMHDIDLAVENGQRAPELGAKEQKVAELANLELIISRVAGQVGTDVGNGSLKQLQEFNALLERAAASLEAGR